MQRFVEPRAARAADARNGPGRGAYANADLRRREEASHYTLFPTVRDRRVTVYARGVCSRVLSPACMCATHFALVIFSLLCHHGAPTV